MEEKFVYYGYVDIYDDVFTEERLYEWKQHIIESYKVIFEGIKNKMNFDSPIRFCMNASLLDEVIIDAVIGMRKITDSSFNSVENPNAFKIAAYLSYWWLRHKPVSVHYPTDYRLEDVNVSEKVDADKKEDERQKLIWQLKHINELVAVQMVSTYIFDFDKRVCNCISCFKVKCKEGEKFSFSSFDEMLSVFLMKLTYYFSYRTIAPKVIEHLLEAYTFHPAWSLTGPHWIGETQGEKT